jgi:N-acyl-D-amino-acid deacylase
VPIRVVLGRSRKAAFVFCAVATLLLTRTASGADLLLKNVVIYDGTGKKGFAGDVRIHGDRIIAVAPQLKPQPGETVREVHGLALAPGFIDMHSHADGELLEDLDAENTTRQGVTTVVIGVDGFSQYPLADYLAKVENAHAAINILTLAGHNTVRKLGLAGPNQLRIATPDEITKMKELLAKELNAGAFGISTGLEYDPGHFSTTDEVIELSKLAAAQGGFYSSHVRDEGNGVFDSFNEIMQIGAGAHLPVEITHIKLATPSVWHQTGRVKQLFEEARRRGIDLRADVYPYTFWQSNLQVIMLDHDFYNPQKVAKALADNGGPDHITFTSYTPDPSVVGKRLDEVAKLWNITPVEAYMKMVKATEPQPGQKPELEVMIMGESMVEDDVRWFIAQPNITFCSDGGLRDRHPRGAGSFPRVLGHYVREEKLLSLELAIHKMTGLPARQLGLSDRGRIAPGMIADLTLFDPATILDGSTIQNPHAPPKGIEAVFVSGEIVVEHNNPTGAHPGKVLRHLAKN